MRTETVTIYKVEDLSPAQFKKAHDRWNDRMTDIPWQEETIESLMAVCKAAGVKVKDYSLGAYNRGNNLRVEIPGDDATAELDGARALAWLENNLFAKFRQSWGLSSIGKYERENKKRYYLPGSVKSCPLTGYCADDEYLDDLRKSVKDGRTLKEAFQDLADVCARMLESEDEYQRTEECFRETCETNDYEFSEEGELI